MGGDQWAEPSCRRSSRASALCRTSARRKGPQGQQLRVRHQGLHAAGRLEPPSARIRLSLRAVRRSPEAVAAAPPPGVPLVPPAPPSALDSVDLFRAGPRTYAPRTTAQRFLGGYGRATGTSRIRLAISASRTPRPMTATPARLRALVICASMSSPRRRGSMWMVSTSARERLPPRAARTRRRDRIASRSGLTASRVRASR